MATTGLRPVQSGSAGSERGAVRQREELQERRRHGQQRRRRGAWRPMRTLQAPGGDMHWLTARMQQQAARKEQARQQTHPARAPEPSGALLPASCRSCGRCPTSGGRCGAPGWLCRPPWCRVFDRASVRASSPAKQRLAVGSQRWSANDRLQASHPVRVISDDTAGTSADSHLQIPHAGACKACTI